MPDLVTQIPAARVPIAEADPLYPSRPWFRFFYNLYTLLGSGSLRNGLFYSTATQTPVAPNTAYPVEFGTTTAANGVTIGTPTSRVLVDRAGQYVIRATLQCESTNAATKVVYVWLDVNGTTVAVSATAATLSGANVVYSLDRNWTVRLSAGDYFRVMWSTSNVATRLVSTAAAAPVPVVPSAALAVSCDIGE